MEKIISNNLPLVSIVIPVYNGANYVSEAIDSALSQDYPNVEVIVVNDGSKDNGQTDSICRGYGDRIRYFHKENGGVSSALNLGISKMQGEYFSWLSHDDKYEPDKISKSLELIINDEGKESIALCGTKHIDSNGKPRQLVYRKVKLKHSYSGLEMFEHCFINMHSINGSALLIPRKAFDECGVFSNLRFAQDLECWSRMMMSGYRFITSPLQLSITRIHSLQGTNRMRKVYFEELPQFYDSIYKFAIQIKETSKRSKFLEILLLTCYTRHYYAKNTIEKIEKSVQLPYLKKSAFKYKWQVVNVIKALYHIIKYRGRN